MTQSHQNINKIIIFFAYCPRILVFGQQQIPIIWLVKGYPITPVIGYKNNSPIHLLLKKTTNHYKRRSKHRWQWGRGWGTKNLVSKEEDDSVLRSRFIRFRKMMMKKRSNKSVCCLLLAILLRGGFMSGGMYIL